LHPEAEGIINCTSPFPLKNKAFMKTIRKIYGFPFGLPAPTWLLKMGAWMIGTETELILKSRWVLPEKISDLGYDFKYPTLEKAVSEILVG
jgi:uncharacterized protein